MFNVCSTFLTSGVADQLFGNACNDSGPADRFSGALGFLASDPISDGDVTDQLFVNVCSDSGAVDQFSGAFSFPASNPISDGAMVFDVEADQLYGNARNDSGADQFSGALVFFASNPISDGDVTNQFIWQRMQ